MSTAGKLFTVINLVLAALFVGSAASLIGTSNEYRSKLEAEQQAHAQTRSELQAQVDDLTAQVQTLSGQAESVRNQLSSEQAKTAALENDVQDARKRNAELNESVGGIEAKLADLEATNRQFANRIAELEDENRALRTERDEALDARDAALAARTAAEEAQRAAQLAGEKLRKELAFANDRADEAEAKLATVVRMSGIDPAAVEGIQPDLEGVVLSTSYDQEPALVQINLGKGDKVLRGYTFDVYNGQTYKGRIKVEVVRENSATCTIALPAGVRIEAGDRVATNL
ncbi:MAG: hypothetical protein D6702_13030 [Planctomycetota bacterium]|nr:MAG: hypothetical protein D6702_13030 [Planctomycetota bacterium]